MVPTQTPFTRALSSPHELIDEIARGVASEELASAVRDAFKDAFAAPDAHQKIPFVRSDNIEQLIGKTVRWTGMIQDNSLGNEIVLASVPGLNGGPARCALYGGDSVFTDSDTSEPVTDPANANLTERAVLYASNVPGRTQWALEADANSVSLARAADGLPIPRRHPRESDEDRSQYSKGIADKIPLPEADEALGMMLKVYDLGAAETLQVTDVVDVIGILDRASMPHDEWASSGVSQSDSAVEHVTLAAPCIHAVIVSRRGDPATQTREESEEADLNRSAESSGSARKEILSQLSDILQGDEEAAEWLLLALIASIHTRKAPFALGHLSLRLLLGAGSSAEVPSTLQAFLQSILPTVAPLKLNLEVLNDPSTRFSPRSDPDTGSLLAGRLQLVSGTLLLIDECIQEGKLGEHGVRNLQSLAEMVKTNTLQYLFPFSPAPYTMPIDTGVIMISGAGQPEGAVGSGGLVQVDVDVAVASPSQSGSKAAKQGDMTSPTLPLGVMRRHILEARTKARSLRVGEDVAESIQKDFVASRSSSSQSKLAGRDDELTEPQAHSQEDLLRRMDIARLICASHGRAGLAYEDYTRAKEMDEARKESLELRKQERRSRA
ncbi:unnamed protein product [Parajaminaea phylloscopi]